MEYLYRQPRSEIYVHGRPARQQVRRLSEPRIYLPSEKQTYVVRKTRDLSPRYIVREGSVSPYVISSGKPLPPRYITNYRSTETPYMVKNKAVIVSNGDTYPRYVTRYQTRQPRLLTALELDLYKVEYVL